MGSLIGINSQLALSICFGASVLALVGILRGKYRSRELQILPIGRWTVTFLTAFWFALRYKYASTMGAPAQPWLGEFFSLLIIICGALTFWLAGSRWWFLSISIVLAFGIAKDVEVILARSGPRPLDPEQALRATYLWYHHWYAAIRDLSMSLWWAVYGFLDSGKRAINNRRLRLFLAFGVPYAVLVSAWVVAKALLFSAEHALFGVR